MRGRWKYSGFYLKPNHGYLLAIHLYLPPYYVLLPYLHNNHLPSLVNPWYLLPIVPMLVLVQPGPFLNLLGESWVAKVFIMYHVHSWWWYMINLLTWWWYMINLLTWWWYMINLLTWWWYMISLLTWWKEIKGITWVQMMNNEKNIQWNILCVWKVPGLTYWQPDSPASSSSSDFFVGLAYYQGKDIVFRFIIEYSSSLMDFSP